MLVFYAVAWRIKIIKLILLLFNSIAPKLDINVIAGRN